MFKNFLALIFLRKKGSYSKYSFRFRSNWLDQRLYKNKKSNNKKPISYSVSKHGLIGLTKYLATYWGPNGVRCNSLSPGGVKNNQPKEFIRKINKLIPMNRMAYKDEYKSAIQFLCSDASSYMNGSNLIIDGGRTVW